MPGLLDAAHGTLPGIGWPPLVEGPAATVLALARHLEASQWLEPETLRRKQFEQLARLLPWLAEHSAAFARRLDAAALSPAALASPERFAELPPVERRWFQQEEGVFCDAVPQGHQPIGQTTTSGSTGEFLRIRRTRANQLVWLAIVLRDHAWWQTDFSVPLLTARAPGKGSVDHPTWGPPAALLFDTGPARVLAVTMTGDQLLEQVEDFGAGNLVIYPNALRTLIEAVEKRGSPPETLRAVRTVGEVVDEALRERARAVLGLEIIDAYTCQEAGYVALQCPESGLYHLMAEALIVEILRPDGSPCGEGETGKVLVTDLHNHATPVVRYALGDYAEVAGPCPCGRGLPTIGRIIGRSRNLLRRPDGSRVWPLTGGFGPEGFLGKMPILQFQFVQTENERIELRLVTARPLTADEEGYIIERARKSLGHPYRIEFRYFEDRLPVPASGKFEDFVCLV